MKRYLPTMLALLFLFVFVFSVAAAITGELTAATTYKCGACCYKPPTTNCTAEYGQLITGMGCSCNAVVCYPTKCVFICKSCS